MINMKNFYGEKQDEGRKLKKCMDILCNNKDHNHKNLQFIELYSISLTLQMNTTSVISTGIRLVRLPNV